MYSGGRTLPQRKLTLYADAENENTSLRRNPQEVSKEGNGQLHTMKEPN